MTAVPARTPPPPRVEQFWSCAPRQGGVPSASPVRAATRAGMCPTTLLAVRTVGSLSSGTPIAALSRSDHVLVSTSSVPYRLAEDVSVQSPSAPDPRREYFWGSETS